jgi:hypothetical protein
MVIHLTLENKSVNPVDMKKSKQLITLIGALLITSGVFAAKVSNDVEVANNNDKIENSGPVDIPNTVLFRIVRIF